MGEIKYRINQPNKSEKNVKILLGGDLSVNHIDELTEKFKQTEKDFNEFEININEVTSFDLATVQLLLTLKKTFDKHKKKIRFKLELPKETWELLETTGFSKELKNL